MGFLFLAFLSAAGGIIAGLVAARLTRGAPSGGLYGGIIGGMALWLILRSEGIAVLDGAAGSAPDPATIANSLFLGAAGGATLGVLAAFLMKKKT